MKKPAILLMLLFLSPLLSRAQAPATDSIRERPEMVREEKIFVVVEQMPEFPGGQVALFKYIKENLVYPEKMQSEGISGTVVLTFVVNEDGSITQIRPIKFLHPELDREAIRVVESMPAWECGKQRGRPVKVRMNLPFKFELDQQ
ncbi:MAG: energy transducer TonB [Bacteroidia bacterium]